jgi:deazaflavin-dependent oxidoreductase (nitroreductase family)
MAGTGTTFPPRSLKLMNRVIIWMQRRGRVVGTMRLLTVQGRKTGKPRTTPVSPLNVEGHDYIVAGYGQSDWVKNARAAGEGVLAKGKRQRRVKLVELPADKRVPIVREFPAKVPHGVPMMLKFGVVTDETPDAFEAAAPKMAVFRIEYS